MNIIRIMRLKNKITQQQLSDMTGLSQPYINELENGKKRNPSNVALDKLANGLKIPVSELLVLKYNQETDN